ncbi:1d5446ec-c98e-4a69-82be-b4339cc19c19 [Thermothielavioides terrestris]|uniref:1d5446ec-c98e-4a69-82be-b4339cc19c19 n=1 Tax=Thermothielavioides terrestris TaxID=2587410 RepID=A0A3S4AS01_9PEZI|nr:1d5446ec-c98e-4a69-82be-b4339cc19c19 [Thermothielavioides terrestris]
MIASRVSTLRFTLQAAFRRPVPPQLARPVGRRGYASLQERVGQSSDRPWQIAALAVSVTGLLLLRRTGSPKAHSVSGHGSSSGEAHVTHSEPARKETKVEAEAESPPEPENEAAEQTAEAAESEGVTDGDSEGAPTPSSSSSEQGESKEMDTSQESQAQKLTDKQSPQPVDPTQK